MWETNHVSVVGLVGLVPLGMYPRVWRLAVSSILVGFNTLDGTRARD